MELNLALQAGIDDILGSMPVSCRRTNYNDIVLVFSDEQKRKLYLIELRCQAQKANESLQAFAMEIEITYPE